MKHCLEFAPTSSTSILATIQEKLGTELCKFSLYTSCDSLKDVSCRRSPNGYVSITIYYHDLKKNTELVFDRMKYANRIPSSMTATNKKSFGFDVRFDAGFAGNRFKSPPFGEMPLYEYTLKCVKCSNILAKPNHMTSINVAGAEDIMEAAIGCCRTHCCDPKQQVSIPTTPYQIAIDDGVILIAQSCMISRSFRQTSQTYTLACAKCSSDDDENNEFFGAVRSPGNLVEIIPSKVDFYDKNGSPIILNTYKCWGNYFANRLVPVGLATYSVVCTGNASLDIVYHLGFFFRRILWLGDAKTGNIRKVPAICFFYTEKSSIPVSHSTPRIRFPDSILWKLKEYLERSHEIYRPFSNGTANWKSAFFCLDCPSQCLANDENLQRPKEI